MAAVAMFEIQVHARKWAINYHPISTKIDIQSKKHMLKSKFTKAEVQAKFQDGCRRHVRNSSECFNMGNYHPISMKIDTDYEKDAEFKKSSKLKCMAIFKTR
jgi:hypothetical protein